MFYSQYCNASSLNLSSAAAYIPVASNLHLESQEYCKPSGKAECLTGIFVEDILDAVPIDKWFEMFKPSAAGEGGFIRVHMSFSEENPAETRKASPTEESATPMGRYMSYVKHVLKAAFIKHEI